MISKFNTFSKVIKKHVHKNFFKLCAAVYKLSCSHKKTQLKAISPSKMENWIINSYNKSGQSYAT